jgi:hypothetical protein
MSYSMIPARAIWALTAILWSTVSVATSIFS